MSGLKKRNEAMYLVLILTAISCLLPFTAGADIYVENQLKAPRTVCSNGVLGPMTPITLQTTNITRIPNPNGTLSIWSCNVGDRECIGNTQNQTATVARLDIGADSRYWLSAELGFNFPLMIMPLGGTGCPTITCKPNLEKCPPELKTSSSSGAMVGCECPPPDSQLYPVYSSLFADSDCPMPCSPGDPSCILDDPSSNSQTCSASVDLLVILIDG